jgi:hypothetical protein
MRYKLSLSRRTPGRCEGAFAATEESLFSVNEILRYAQDDIFEIYLSAQWIAIVPNMNR